MITFGGWPEPGYRVDIEGQMSEQEEKAADKRMLVFLGMTGAALVGANILMNAAEKRAKRGFKPAVRAGRVEPLPLP